ncbi:MAG: hypothetical protein AAGJ40_16235 [Planctomycetota bacterium]
MKSSFRSAVAVSTMAKVMAICLAANATALAQRPALLRMFGRAPKVTADPAADYALSEVDGPWMILAHTFVGEGSEGRARRLALEIRNDLQLPAFIHQQQFDFTGEINPGRPLQQASAAAGRHMRYRNQVQYTAHAVLVGEYDHVDHPRIDSDLQRVKSAPSAVVGDQNEVEAETDLRNPVTAIKAIHRQFIRLREDEVGPMARAFVIRNPLLPEEFFQPPRVDSYVRSINEDNPYSLLTCDGNFTVVVRTFEGLGTIQGTKESESFKPSLPRINAMGAQAERMAAALRDDGHEAYTYHDRHRSLVTIGSFQSLGRELPGGQFQYDSKIRAVMSEFRAFNVDPKLARHVNGRTSQGVAANNVDNIPFDVQPTPIAVPRVNKRALFGALSR